MTLAAPPQQYNQLDESQNRREIESGVTDANARIDAVLRILEAQVVTEAALLQTNASDIVALAAGVPSALNFPTDLRTDAPNRWSEPVDGTLRHTAVEFARLGLVFGFFQLQPTGNNQTFLVEFLSNDVVQRSIEFQTGNSGLLYPVSVAGLVEFGVGNTDIRMQLTNENASQDATISDFSIQAADFFSALGFELNQVATDSLAAIVPIGPDSFLRTLVNHFAALMPVGTPVLTSQNRHRISGDVGLGNLATGYAQQRGGPNTIVIPAANTFVALNPVTTLSINSSAWLQPGNAELSIISDTKRIATVNLVMVLDTTAANQMFEFRILLDGVPQGSPYPVLLQGNQPQEHALGFLIEIPVGLTVINLEVQNTSTGQDLDVDDYFMAITDQLADG